MSKVWHKDPKLVDKIRGALQQGGSVPQFLCSGGLGGFPAEAEQRRDGSRSEENRETAEVHKNEQSQQGLAAPGAPYPCASAE